MSAFGAFLDLQFLLSVLPAALVGSLGLFLSLSLIRVKRGFSHVALVSFASAYSIPILFSIFPLPIPIGIVNFLAWVALSKFVLRLTWKHAGLAGLLGYGIYFGLSLLGLIDWIETFLKERF